MTHFEDQASDLQSSNVLPGLLGVRDDMVAIFGSDQRVDHTPIARAQPRRPRGRRGLIIAAVSLCGAGAMLAAGVVGGKNVLNAAPPDVSTSRGLHKDARNASPARRQAAAVALPVQPAPAVAAMPDTDFGPLMPAVAAAPSIPSARTVDAVRGVAKADGADAVVRRDPAIAARPTERPRPDTTMATVGNPAEPAGVRTRSTSPEPDRITCSTNDECVNVRLYYDDQDVAAAYQQATIAGVRPRTLREYRAEWMRARTLATKRPAESARVYEMIESDLRLLAADPTID